MNNSDYPIKGCRTYKRRFFAAIVLSCIFAMNLPGCGLFVERIPSGTILDRTEEDRFVKIGDVNYHYREYPATGQDIFLLHGFASSTYSWETTAPLLHEHGYHVWALDMKGFGWSDKPEGADYSPLTLMEEVKSWLDEMNLASVVFVGNSLGGAIGVLLALEHPEKVGSLVLVDSGGYPKAKPLIIDAARIPFSGCWMNLFLSRWVVEWNLRRVYHHGDRVSDETVDAYYDRLRTEHALDAQVSLAKSIDFDLFEEYIVRLPEIQAPTLIIWGENDRWVPLECGYNFRRDIPNSKLVVIPECGHVPQEEHPAVTTSFIVDFVEGRPIEESPIPEKEQDSK